MESNLFQFVCLSNYEKPAVRKPAVTEIVMLVYEIMTTSDTVCFSVTGLNSLEVLDISGNKLQTTLDLSGLKALKELRVTNCTLTSIPER